MKRIFISIYLCLLLKSGFSIDEKFEFEKNTNNIKTNIVISGIDKEYLDVMDIYKTNIPPGFIVLPPTNSSEQLAAIPVLSTSNEENKVLKHYTKKWILLFNTSYNNNRGHSVDIKSGKEMKSSALIMGYKRKYMPDFYLNGDKLPNSYSSVDSINFKYDYNADYVMANLDIAYSIERYGLFTNSGYDYQEKTIFNTMVKLDFTPARYKNVSFVAEYKQIKDCFSSVSNEDNLGANAVNMYVKYNRIWDKMNYFDVFARMGYEGYSDNRDERISGTLGFISSFMLANSINVNATLIPKFYSYKGIAITGSLSVKYIIDRSYLKLKYALNITNDFYTELYSALPYFLYDGIESEIEGDGFFEFGYDDKSLSIAVRAGYRHTDGYIYPYTTHGIAMLGTTNAAFPYIAPYIRLKTDNVKLKLKYSYQKHDISCIYKQRATLVFSYRFASFLYNIYGSYIMRDDIDSYILLNTRINVRLDRFTSIYCGVYNLFDKRVQVVDGYLSPGRYFFGGIALKF